MSVNETTEIDEDKRGWTFIDAQVHRNELVLTHRSAVVAGRSAARLRPARFAEAVIEVARWVTGSGADLDTTAIRRGVRERRIGRAVRGFDGTVHSVAVWVGRAEISPPPVPTAGAWAWAPQQRATYWSDELYELYGIEHNPDRSHSIHQFLQMLGPEDAIKVARVVSEVDETDPDRLLGETFWAQLGNGAIRRLHAFGRVVESPELGRLWRGTSIDVTDHEDSGTSERSVLGMVLSYPAGVQSALVELPRMRLLRWISQGLPEVPWPSDGHLDEVILVAENHVRELDPAAIAQLPPTSAQTVPVRLRTVDGGSIRAQMQAQILDSPSPATPALVVIQRI